MNTHTFSKQDDSWYLKVNESSQAGGSQAYLPMETGRDTILDFLSRGKNKVTLSMDTEPFEGAELLSLEEICDAPKGGGYYLLHRFKGRLINKKVWLCDTALFLFGDVPERIYVKRGKTQTPVSELN
ncbi:DUF6717 family protein [Paraflavisolibacter sp. H34]|uniref:DUF6717 family protein n=1 Tax=Huijunlia imazamoxiresistens TaxID=3127457 RepID=UPI0030180FFA